MSDNLINSWKNVGHAEGVHEQEQVFFDMFFKKASVAKKILEIGVGNGRMQRVLLRGGVERSVLYGIDLTDQVYKSEGHVQKGDARALPYEDNEFDLVYSLGVVEHFKETLIAVDEHLRVAVPGAMILITTPHVSLESIHRFYSYYRTGRHKAGTFMETKGRNMRVTTFLKYLNTRGDVKILSIGCSGPISRYLKRRLPNLYNTFLKRFEPIMGSYLHIVMEKLR